MDMILNNDALINNVTINLFDRHICKYNFIMLLLVPLISQS